MIEEKDLAMWWAQKEFMRGKTLQDYVGKNEKTKIITKIQKVCRVGCSVCYKDSLKIVIFMYLE